MTIPSLFLLAFLINLSSCEQYYQEEKSIVYVERTKPTPVQFSFAQLKEKILVPKCLNCHDSAQAKGKISLLTYENLLKSEKGLIIPKQPELSRLLIVVSPQSPLLMPPPIAGIQNLTQDELDWLWKWIEMGAPE